MNLTAHQQEILDRLRDPGCPRRALVQAPAGTGARRPIELLIEDMAQMGSVLVLAPTRSMVESWAASLLDRPGLAVAVIDSAESALAFAEDPRPRTGQVLLATYARLQHGASRRALTEMTFALLVADEPLRGVPEAIRDVLAASQRTVALTSGPIDASFAGLPTIARVSLEDVIRDGDLLFEEVVVQPGPDERTLLNAAEELVHQAMWMEPFGRHISRTRPWLHSVLLRIANRRQVEPVEALQGKAPLPPEATPDLSPQAWELLDRFDELGPDPRLEVLEDVLTRSFAGGNGALLTTATVAEAEYVHAHLLTVGYSVIGMLTGTSRPAERRQMIGELIEGSVLVATNVVHEMVDRLPPHVDVVSWSEPAERQAGARRLALLQVAAGRTIYQISENRE